jgi:hypothetical protein
MNSEIMKTFTKAELEHLREKARNANTAIAIHNEFVEFLRVQHEAPEREGWLLGAVGFEMTQAKNETPPPADTGEGVNGLVAEEVQELS